MLYQEDIDKIVQCAEDLGWGVNIDARISEGNAEFEFNTDTPCGQDVWVTCYLTDGDPNTLVKSVYDYWQSYDPDEEAMLWVGPDGHGRNGAPYRISDIVHDMEHVEKRLEELYDALSQLDFDYEED